MDREVPLSGLSQGYVAGASETFRRSLCELRRSGTPIEQALVLVGHEFRLRQPEYQLVLR
jgi:hypothetical protein